MTEVPSNRTKIQAVPGPFRLESGAALPRLEVAYRTWGRLNAARDNAVLLCHGLTGSADADRWWPGMIAPGGAFDPEEDFIVCANVLGGCSGTTGPASPHPEDGRPWGARFPPFTVRDVVAVQARLLEELGVARLRLAAGGSFGGMQVLEWAAMFPERLAAGVAIATSARHSAWCIGWSEAQRQAIFADPNWNGGFYPTDSPPAAGLAAARMIAMGTYRSRASLERRFSRGLREPGTFAVESYLRHQGDKLVARFDANSYVALTRAMDSHDLARGRGRMEDVLASISVPLAIVAIGSDVLYPPEEQEALARRLPAGSLFTLASDEGHDAFLIDIPPLERIIRGFREALAARPALTEVPA